jgi:hypothetical protein
MGLFSPDEPSWSGALRTATSISMKPCHLAALAVLVAAGCSTQPPPQTFAERVAQCVANDQAKYGPSTTTVPTIVGVAPNRRLVDEPIYQADCESAMTTAAKAAGEMPPPESQWELFQDAVGKAETTPGTALDPVHVQVDRRE